MNIKNSKEKIKSKARHLMNKYFSNIEEQLYKIASNDIAISAISKIKKFTNYEKLPSDEKIKQYKTKYIRQNSETLVDIGGLNDEYFEKFEDKYLKNRKSFLDSALKYKLLSELEKLEVSYKKNEEVENVVDEINKMILELQDLNLEKKNIKSFEDRENLKKSNKEFKIER
jgi:hypothetical protein